MIWAEATTMGDVLLRTAERQPSKEALVFGADRFSYAEVRERALAAARSLAGLGVRRGDRVGLLMPNCPDFVFAFFGIQLLGAVAVPINTRFRARELGYVIENAGLVALLTSDIVDEAVDFVQRLGEALPGLAGQSDPAALALPEAPRLRSLVLLGERDPDAFLSRVQFDALGAAVSEQSVLDGRLGVRVRDIGLMLFTSGTTAAPKGCLLTHEAVVRIWCATARLFRIGEADRIWDALPMFHMSCIGPLIFTFELGATLVSMTHFEPGAALQVIERERASWLYTVFPPIAMALVKHPAFADTDRSAIRGLMNVAPPDTLSLIQDAFAPARQMGGHFGMTECAGAITCNVWDATRHQQVATCGAPVPGVEVRVVDPETGAVLGADTRGELQIRGIGLFEGYHGDPEATAASFTDDGWLRSGDAGQIDADGMVIYLGRIKDMMKVGGENVAPAEIESHLSTHPAVKLVQVVAVPDPRLDEVPAAFIELAPGGELTEAEAIAYCEGQIASFKVPRHVRFVTEWPMSATKIQKFRLRDALVAELESPARR
jgi:acyl-CoA synthetase (AMP-forming)/AMP-acid ligase II